VHVDVWAVVIELGEAITETDVTVMGAAVTVTLPEPDFVESSVEVAVMVAVPVDEGVNTPALVTVPPVAVHVTAEL
jgi:hypothetical protein